MDFKRCLISSSLFEVFALGVASLYRIFCSVIVVLAIVFCRYLCTCLWSLCWRRCLRCAKRCSLCFTLCCCRRLLRSQWDLLSLLHRSYGEKSSPWRISRHLFCLLFCFREIARDSPIINIVSQTMNKHIMNTPWKCALVMLPSKRKCAVKSNYCMRSWRPPSDIYKYRWAVRVCSSLWSTRGLRTACLS